MKLFVLALQLSFLFPVRGIVYNVSLLPALGAEYPATAPLEVDLGDGIRIYCNTTGNIYRYVNEEDFDTCVTSVNGTRPDFIGRCHMGNPPLIVTIVRQNLDLPSVVAYEKGTAYYFTSFEEKVELPSGPDCSLGIKMAFQVSGSTDDVTTSATASTTIDLDTQGLTNRNSTLSTTTIIIIGAGVGGGVLTVGCIIFWLLLFLCLRGGEEGKKKKKPKPDQGKSKPGSAESSIVLLNSKPVSEPAGEAVSIQIHGKDPVKVGYSKGNSCDGKAEETQKPSRPAPSVPSAEPKSGNRVRPSDAKPLISSSQHSRSRETPSSNNRVTRSMTESGGGGGGGGGGREGSRPTQSYSTSAQVPKAKHLSPIPGSQHASVPKGGSNSGANIPAKSRTQSYSPARAQNGSSHVSSHVSHVKVPNRPAPIATYRQTGAK